MDLQSPDWMDSLFVNRKEWNYFHVIGYDNAVQDLAHKMMPMTPYKTTSSKDPFTTPISQHSTPFSQRQGTSSASNFRKGIKCDKSHYKEIKDDKQWDEWKRSTMATIYTDARISSHLLTLQRILRKSASSTNNKSSCTTFG